MTGYTLFSCAKAGNTFFSYSPVEIHMLGHKTRLNKLRKTEITPSVFFDHKCTQLEINKKKKNAKDSNTQKLNNMLLNKQWVNEEIKQYFSQCK